MARPTFTIGFLMLAAVVATPALAQFGSIFSDSPPRPPADVPQSRPQDEWQEPGLGRPLPPPAQRPRADEPPSQPLPAPMSLPPSSRPGAGGIQSQDLAPPPGTTMAPLPDRVTPQAPAGEQPQQPGQANVPGGRGGAQQPADTAPRPGDEIVVEPPPQRIANPTAVFSGLDKITGRIISFDVAINETVQFGALQVTPRVCYSRPPTETPNTDAFIEVDEVTLQGEIKRIFTGWMFAASPGLHAIEHPIYDVWLNDCKGAQQPNVASAPADQPARAQPQQQQRRTPTTPAQPQRPAQPQPRAQQLQPGFQPTFR